MTGAEELSERPDAPVLVVHARNDISDDWLAEHVDAARRAFPGMCVMPLHGLGIDVSALTGRDVVIWPWMGSADARASLRPAAGVLARTAKRVRLIAPKAEDACGPGGLNGHDPIAWARECAEDVPASALDDLLTEWGLEEGPPLEETHDLVSDYAPHPDILEPDAEPRQRFGFRSAAELVAEPAPTDWLVQGWFERNTLAMYFGDPSSCKTWVALSQAVHVALGTPWFGARVQQGAVFILCGEGHRGFRRRLEGLRRYHEMDYTGVPLFVSDGPAALTEEESVRDVLQSVERLVTETGYAPALVVIDTLSRNFGGADENATSDMAMFVGACDRIRTTYGCTILVVHHSGHGDKNRGRGNSALRAALDAEFRFARDEDGGIEAACTKAKDFEAPEPRRFELVNVALDWPAGDDGLPVNSAAIAPVGDAFIRDAFSDSADVPRGTSGADYIGPNQRKALEQLEQEFVKRMRNIKAQDRDPFSARVSVMEWRELTGLDRKRFSEVRKTLEDREMVRCDGIYVTLANH